jgi:hypothetical protein
MRSATLDVAQVPATGDDLRLMAVVAQACDLPQAQPAIEEAHGLIVQEIIHPAPIDLGATPDEPPLIDAPTALLAIGQHVEAVLDHNAE